MVPLRKGVVEGFMPCVVGTSQLVVCHWLYREVPFSFQRGSHVLKYTILVCHIMVQINYTDFIGR